MDFDDGATELAARAVDEAVERRHARELAVGERQAKGIALAELQRRTETTRRRHDRRRRVDAERIDAVCGQISGDLSGVATEIAHARTMVHGGGGAIEHVAVEWLAVELVEVLRRRCHRRETCAVCIISSPSVRCAREPASGLRKLTQ